MAGNLSFSIALNLLTENFKKGTNTVKNGFRSMQMQVLTFAAALGAGGLGLSNFVSRLIDVARETNRVITALKNVSGSTAQYADNQRFLLDMAKKYGLEINSLTGAYAKFTAASQVSGVSMMNQRKIFESVSRACTAFSMSADDSNSVFLALSQMMSKGKISSEELRLQMGERLPVALQAMAKAAGVSVAGLDKLLKQGKLMSADVLPKFADALNEMIPNVDTDNLETSVNRLKNVFTEFTKKTGVGEHYKSLIDSLTKLIEAAGNNIKNILIGILAVVTFVVTNAVTKTIRGWGSTVKQIEAFSATMNNRLLAATERRVAAEIALEDAKEKRRMAVGDEIEKAKKKEKTATTKVANAIIAETKVQEAAKLAAAKAAAVGSSGAWNRAYVVMRVGALKLAIALKAMWATFAPALIATALIATVGYFTNLYKEAKRIKNIFSNYKKESSAIGGTKEIENLKSLYAIASDVKESYNDRKKAVDQLNEKLGTTYNIDANTLKINGDINAKIGERIKLLQSAAAVDFYTQKKLDAQDKIEEHISRRDSLKPKSGFSFVGGLDKLYASYKYSQNEEEIKQLQKVVSDADAKMLKYTKDSLDENTVVSADEGDTDTKKTSLQKAEESYAKKLRELEAKREIENISVSDYNNALDELNRNTLIDAQASGDKSILESKYYANLKKSVDNPLYTEQQKSLDAFLKVEKDYNEEKKKLQNRLTNGVISQEDYNDELIRLSETTAKTAGSLSNIGEAGKQFINTLQTTITAGRVRTAPGKEKRDTTFDYKKSEADIAEEELSIAKKNLDAIKDLYDKGAKSLATELDNAMLNVTSLEEALKISQVKEDIKNLNKSLTDSLYSGIKDIAGSTDRVVSAFQSLNDVFSDVDSSGWERILSVWNAITQSIDAYMSVMETVKNITEITKGLTKAKESEQAIIGTGTEVAAAAAGQVAMEAIAAKEIITSKSVTAAYQAEMAAKTMAAYAAMPFVGFGIATAQIAAMKVLITASSIPGFKDGGIVGGVSYSGDKVLARVNSGEMIINKTQQASLFNMLNGGGGIGGNIQVSGRLIADGGSLVAVIESYNRRQRRIK